MNKGKNIFEFKNTRGIHEGKYYIDNSASLSGYIYLGEYSIINSESLVCNTTMGRFVDIGRNVRIGLSYIYDNLLMNHPIAYYRNIQKYFTDPDIIQASKDRYYFENNPITTIGSDTRVFDGAFIASGVSIGKSCVIYPNSVVVDDVPDYSVVAGNPAQVLKKRISPAEIDLLNKFKIEEIIFNDLLVNDKKYNFSDFEALSKLKDQKKIRDIKKYRFTGNPNKKEKSFHSNLLVIGPSHIQRWLSRIESGKLPEPDYELWGIGGLSIYSQSIQNLCQFWLSHDDNNKILVFVPDFRIGNSVLYEKSSNAMFIYKNLMSSISADSKLKQKTFDILDRLTYKYKERVKFLFWCQYGRQMINIRAGKYIDPNIEIPRF